MESIPKVSIVTPSYNQGVYLERTILSVLSQDYPNLEYIIIDGGSSDNSPETILKYADRLACWVSKPDRGQTHAINKGLQAATGDILVWLNSDDLLLPGALSAVAECFRQHPEAGFVYGDCHMIDAAGRYIFNRKVIKYDWGTLFYGRSLVSQPASFFRRNVVDEIGLLDERLFFCMDLEYWIRAACRGIKFHMLPVPLACFRMHGSTKTAQQRKRMLAEHLMILQMYGPWPWKHLGPAATYLQYVLNSVHHARSVLLRMRQRRELSLYRARRAQRLVASRGDDIS